MSNLDKYSSGQVIKKVNNEVSIDFNQYDHSCLYYLFSVHPYGYEKKNIELYETNNNYCLYDEPHKDYVFYMSWIEFIIQLINSNKLAKNEWRSYFKKKVKLNIEEYL